VPRGPATAGSEVPGPLCGAASAGVLSAGLRILAPLGCRFGQPGGFEGFCAVREQGDSHDLALPEGPDHSHVQLDCNSARLAPRVGGQDGDDLIACVDQVLDLIPDGLPGLAILPPPVPEPLVSPVDLSLDQTLDGTPSVVPLDLGVVEREQVAVSRRATAANSERTASTLSCDIAYSPTLAAWSASALRLNIRQRTIRSASKSYTWLTEVSTGTPLSLPVARYRAVATT
jgi:hypothetical protein